MHAHPIIQDLLCKHCPQVHAKRRNCLAKVVDACIHSGLTLLKMSQALASHSALKHRIKCCDRLLSNPHLYNEKETIYSAMAGAVLNNVCLTGIVIDWSDLLRDGSAHLLRAAVIVKGRAFTLYEQVFSNQDYAKPAVHRQFLLTLRQILPEACRPVLITDAGFRASWFKLANELQFEWVGRIRNRDMVRIESSDTWNGCKTWYPEAKGSPRSLGQFEYARSNPIACRLVIYKKPHKNRHNKTAFGKNARNHSSLKSRAAQIEPWLLACSPSLASVSATRIVDLYAGRMQIEQTFRDVKNPQWGMGLSDSQTTRLGRLAILLLIGALASYALWLIGLAAQHTGFEVTYGSKKKAANTLSIISLARFWISEKIRLPSRSALAGALRTLTELVYRI